MSILVNVVNQKMYVSSNADGLVAGSQQFVQFKFNLSSEWDGSMTFAQLRTGTKMYNRYLDENNCVIEPRHFIPEWSSYNRTSVISIVIGNKTKE